ncbi:DUF309 domain-containing protein [Ruegeria marina]|uniref:DUF309 domain-containing protein n=1 Tax=Ruegeria marina TaxID=639004 RepID=A0A1G6PB06_9RHOB|nr:DUF309 domain-containing protein [Ruegeria marina]SDC77181.1 hypothetical protein SAMN04488239_103354 [Ruegeria marina]
MGWTPAYPAYVPGQTLRPPDDAYADLRETVKPGMTPEELADCRAWTEGWRLFDAEYFWEAHEVWEPIWMQLPPNSAARHVSQAAIQLANAALKIRMGRPGAALRLCKLAREHVIRTNGRQALGMHPTSLLSRIEKVEERLRLCAL